jgi:hypothetical protein
MRKAIVILTSSILLQSCFSYKAVENNSSQYEIGKSYRVHLDKESEIVRINSKTDSTLVVWSDFNTKTIFTDSFSKVEKRKFSIIKTVLLPVTIITSLVLLFAVYYSN